jgi:hypothetical protein
VYVYVLRSDYTITLRRGWSSESFYPVLSLLFHVIYV